MPTPTQGTAWQFSSLTGEPAIDALISGTQWSVQTLSFSFPTVDSSWSTDPDLGYGPTNGAGDPWSAEFAALTTTDQAAVRSSLASWAAVANLKFAETADTETNVGTLRFGYTYTAEMEGAQAYAYLPADGPRSGDVWFNTRGTSGSSEWTRGTHEYMTVVHEIGHALGLKHPFEGTPQSPGTIDPQLDSRAFTVMSYAAQPSAQGTYFDFEPTTPMVLDVAAIQALYGANTTYNATNTTYTFSGTSTYHRTIWDAGGSDTIVYNASAGGEIDLTAGLGGGSSLGRPVTVFGTDGNPLYQQTYNVWIAYGSVIEHATGGSGGDTIIGNAAANRLDGRGGNDTVTGGSGNDTLVASVGSDRLNGGIGSDTISFASAALGIKVNLGSTVAQATNQGTVTLASVERAVGSAFADALTGSTLANTLSAGTGNDTLSGSTGSDTLTGGSGNDVFVLGSLVGSDQVLDFASGFDDVRIRMGTVRIGDGDTVVEGASVRTASGGFSNTAELVIFSSNASALTAAAAAAKIGAATAAYTVGRSALFVVDTGTSSALYRFVAADGDAAVEANELLLLATLTGTGATQLGDYVFGA